MKKLFTPILKKILFLAFLILTNLELKAVTPLVAGDIAFTGFIGTPNVPTPDEFSFVLLKTIDATTTIKFTDAGWLSGTNAFRAGETIITWTPPAGGLTAGKEIHIVGLTATLAGGGSGGTVTGATLSLNGNNGDQVLAYIGTEASPTFISAIHTNVYTLANSDPVTTNTTVWDGVANDLTASALPPGLTNGSTAIWLGVTGDLSSQRGNGKFNAGALDLSTAANVRTAVNNRLNWLGEPLGQPPTPAFTLPTNAAFLSAPLPVKLVSFNGKINEEKAAALSWKVTEQLDIQEYNIEKSTDAINFNSIGKVIANKQSKTDYGFTDSDLAVGKNHYRLKMVEQNGSYNLSKIIVVDFKPEIMVTLYPNPTSDLLSIDQIGDYKNQKADLINEKGVLVKTFTLKKDSKISLKDLPSGLYIMKLADGKTIKLLKNN